MTIFELFEPAPNDFHLYKRLEHDTRQQKLFISIRLFTLEQYEIVSCLGKFCTQLLLILNNIFPLRLRKTVFIAASTPPKHIPAFDKKSSLDIQAVPRRKNDQKIPAIFKNLERVDHRVSGLLPSC